MSKSQEPKCYFCHGTREERGPLIENGDKPSRYICHNCVSECGDVFAKELEKQLPVATKLNKIPSPREMFEYLNRHVIGQDEAKKRLCVRVVNHYRHLCDVDARSTKTSVCDPELANVVIEKQNMLIYGPTGSGKTLLAKTIADILNVPFAIADATTLTEAGYVGEDVENILLKLLVAADYDLEACQRGIIYIDEIDKKLRTTSNVSITRDVSGEGVQQALLKMLEGTISNVAPQGGRKHPEQQFIQIDTSNILFIVGGAFNGLEDIVAKRLSRKKIGFSSPSLDDDKEEWELLQLAEHDDFIQLGLIPELVGRLPVLAPLKRLDTPELIRVLTEPENALIKQERKLASFQDVDLEFTEGAIRMIAEKAHEKETGARGLVAVISEFMDKIFFDLDDSHRGKKLIIDERVVSGMLSIDDLLSLHEKAA